MVIVFDLDDTLYDEISFVHSGFRAVAEFGEANYGWSLDGSLQRLQCYLATLGRGEVFDYWLRQHSVWSHRLVKQCVHVYRHHHPKIELFPYSREVLEKARQIGPIYLVTDGHKIVQKNKIVALGLEATFKRSFITHRFGIKNAKPSLHCFDIIRRSERCSWEEMMYVGDNPNKDFISLNRVGARTVRVMTGAFASTFAKPGYDALVTVSDLSKLPDVW
jgi:putative hydrolase of the HAD superfamily